MNKLKTKKKKKEINKAILNKVNKKKNHKFI